MTFSRFISCYSFTFYRTFWLRQSRRCGSPSITLLYCAKRT